MTADELISWLQAVRHPSGDYTQGEAMAVVVGEINRLHLESGQQAQRIEFLNESVRKIRLRLVEVAASKHTTLDEAESIHALLRETKQ